MKVFIWVFLDLKKWPFSKMVIPERMIQGKSRVGVKLTLGPESPMNYFIEDFQGLKIMTILKLVISEQ